MALRQTAPHLFETDDDPITFGAAEIARVIAAAKAAPQGRARILLHPNRDDSLHEMVIAIPKDSCDHPHINFRSGKSFLALSGRFAVVCCSDDGKQIEAHVLSAGPWPGALMARLRAAAWHTIIPLDGDTAFLETNMGPFTGNRFADWFPGEVDADRLRALARAAADRLDTSK